MIHNNKNKISLQAAARVLWNLNKSDDFPFPEPTYSGLLYRKDRQRGVRPVADVFFPEKTSKLDE